MAQEIYFKGASIDEEPKLLFDNADTSAVNKEPYYGLKAFGPFDKQCTTLKIGIIAPKSSVDAVKRFVAVLQSGDSKFFAGGMQQFFRTKLTISHVVESAGITLKDYEEAGKNFVAKAKQGDTDVVLCFIPLTSNVYINTPYYRLKAILSLHNLPSQMLTQKTIDNPTFSYLNVASAIFAKSGFIPWALGAEMPNTDIIIGISVSDRICDENRIIKNRYVGYVNVFDQYGKWMFFEGVAEAYNKEDIPNKIVMLVKRAVERYKNEKGVFPEKVHIHYWKRFSRKEKESVNNMLKELNANVRIAYTSINSDHPYRFYDLESLDGSLMRGYYAYFNDDILLSTTGTTTEFRKSPYRMGTPKLLHLKTEQYPETFISKDELVHQVLALTKLNWATSSLIIREPITLTFSQALANLTSAITESEWQEIQKISVNPNMRNKPWFI